MHFTLLTEILALDHVKMDLLHSTPKPLSTPDIYDKVSVFIIHVINSMFSLVDIETLILAFQTSSLNTIFQITLKNTVSTTFPLLLFQSV